MRADRGMTLTWYLFPIVCLFSLVQAKCLCPPGTYLTKQCKSQSDASCEKCPEGTFNSDYNNASACKPCYHCDSGKEEVEKCTAIRNTKCACPVSSFFNSDIHRCIACTKCSEGQVYVNACSTYNDFQCRDCPEGTFSVQLSNTCQQCSHCKEGQMVQQVCSLASDTLCKTVEELPTTSTTRDLVQVSSQTPALNRSSSYRSSDVLCPKPVVSEAIVWTLIGIVVLETAILIAVTICPLLKWKTSGQKSTKVGSDAQKSKQKTTMIRTAESTFTIKETGLKFRDVSYEYTVNLATLLNPNSDKNWKALAASMGYKSGFVANLELEPQDATQALLRDWACSTNATVFRLYTLLNELPRDDAAGVLLPLLENNSCHQQAEFV